MSDTADFDKHTDTELERGVERAREEEPRLAEEGSQGQLEAERRQREAMEAELDERQS